jgi:SAM-dependent methyltransferase
VDELASFNKARWEEIAGADSEYTRPWLDLDAATARARLDPEGLLGEPVEKEVLCLANGGGQQSTAFGLLGARVTVLDLSETQLERDRLAATHHGLSIKTVQGDMRDLSCFGDDSFDVVWHAYSINFVPDARVVFREVARVLRPSGLYHLGFANPYTVAVDEDAWDGESYPLRHPYLDGVEVSALFPPHWDVTAADGMVRQIASPREFRHTLGRMVNGLVGQGFVILRMGEETSSDPNPIPGTWEHFKSVAAPYLSLWARFQPWVFEEAINDSGR